MTSIHFVGYHPPTSVQSRAMQVVRKALDETMGDRIQFRFTSDIAELGRKANDLLPMVEAGELDGCYFYSSYLTKRVPELGLLEMPFQFGDRGQFFALLDGALGERIRASFAANTGYRLLAFWDNGIRHVSNAKRPIRTPADCKGLRIRTAFNDFHQACFRAMGFEPVAIDVKDLPAAVRDGTVDAQENPLTNVMNYQVQAYHPYITLTAHLFGANAVLVNAARYEAWPAEVREALGQALEAGTAAQRRYAAEEDDICTRKLTAEGTQIIALSEAERAAFAAAVGDVVAAERRRYAPDLLALLDKQ